MLYMPRGSVTRLSREEEGVLKITRPAASVNTALRIALNAIIA